ncbi:MAG: RHS repeat-associated core domain-containing protein [Bacteroidales bacterium]|nr:RHS repeat-associated core domain-containing protein [Bacteroidales bacterium]
MHTSQLTYHPSYCPHTYGVRLGPCGSFATNPCRPTACAGIAAEPAPNVHCWLHTFSAKEKDSETGLSYFGSRYYSSDLSIWLSVDPMSDKYASLSPYVYCADNPIKLVDPDGEEIEYNSFSDRIIVGLLKIFDSGFRKQFKELKKSEEIYVFKKNDDGLNDFITDGNKLFIQYSSQPKKGSEKSPKDEDQTIFSLLRHETTHAIQFENGKLGFYKNGETWVPICYDITDEVEAWENQNKGSRWSSNPESSYNKWPRAGSNQDKINYLQNNYSNYKNLSTTQQDIIVGKRVKDDHFYFRPSPAR